MPARILQIDGDTGHPFVGQVGVMEHPTTEDWNGLWMMTATFINPGEDPCWRILVFPSEVELLDA